jgi:hypothetical protein
MEGIFFVGFVWARDDDYWDMKHDVGLTESLREHQFFKEYISTVRSSSPPKTPFTLSIPR